MWQRHPVLKIIVHHVPLINQEYFFIVTTIKLTFAGIYTFELERTFGEPVTEQDLDIVRMHDPELLPTRFKEIFPLELSSQEEEKFKEMLMAEIEWERTYMMSIEAHPLTEWELEQREIELQRKERGRILIDKVLKFVSEHTEMWISLIDPITGTTKLEMGYYEKIDWPTRRIVKSSLNLGIQFIGSVAFC